MADETVVPDDKTHPPEMPEREVEFQGRMIWVRFPRPEQLLVWQRTVRSLQKIEEGNSWTGDNVMAALERGAKIINSIMVHQADRDWMDDQMLEGNLGFAEAAGLIQKAVEAFQANDRQERRKNSPAKKAVRRKAAQ